MAGEFEVHRLNERGLACCEEVARLFDDLLHALEGPTAGELSQSRERAIVVTKLQEACFFAKRAVATQPEFQAKYAPHDIVVDQDESWCRACGWVGSHCTREPTCTKYAKEI